MSSALSCETTIYLLDLVVMMNDLCQVSRADLMAPNSSFSPLRDGGPDLSCEEEDDISYRLEPLPSSQPVLPPPPCRPFSATSLSTKRSVGDISVISNQGSPPLSGWVACWQLASRGDL